MVMATPELAQKSIRSDDLLCVGDLSYVLCLHLREVKRGRLKLAARSDK